jgi:hypothetical protein
MPYVAYEDAPADMSGEVRRLREALERVVEECGAIHFQRSNVYRIASTALSSQHGVSK